MVEHETHTRGVRLGKYDYMSLVYSINRAIAARSEVVRLNSSVGLPVVRRKARGACCCRGVWGYPPQEIFGLLRWFLMGKNVATGVYIDSSAVGTVLAG